MYEETIFWRHCSKKFHVIAFNSRKRKGYWVGVFGISCRGTKYCVFFKLHVFWSDLFITDVASHISDRSGTAEFETIL